MYPLPVALVLGFLLLMFATAALAFSVAIWVNLLWELPEALKHWTSALGWLLYAFLIGGLMLMVGYGAFTGGMAVLDGIITRLTSG